MFLLCCVSNQYPSNTNFNRVLYSWIFRCFFYYLYVRYEHSSAAVPFQSQIVQCFFRRLVFYKRPVLFIQIAYDRTATKTSYRKLHSLISVQCTKHLCYSYPSHELIAQKTTKTICMISGILHEPSGP